MSYKILLYLLLFSSQFLSAQTGNWYCEEGGVDAWQTSERLSLYWKLRQLHDAHFMKIALDEYGHPTDDGIGTWQRDENSHYLRYSKAGYSIPGANLLISDNPVGDTWACGDCQYHTQNDPVLKNYNNVLTFGDAAARLGSYYARLAAEYRLLADNGQHAAKKIIINELFLGLQAYRRLDMTAVRLTLENFRRGGCLPADAQDEEVLADGFYGLTLDGYSGHFVRSDVPFDFANEFKETSAAVEPSWQIAMTESGYAIDLDFHKDLLSKENMHDVQPSQDQVVGLLYGLIFIKKLVDPEETVVINGETYNIVEMTENIALAVVKRITDNDKKLKIPQCSDGSAKTVNAVRGHSAAWNIHAMKKVLDNIKPDNDVPSLNEDMWTAQRVGIFTGAQNNNQVNVRMFFYLLVSFGGEYNTLAQQRLRNSELAELDLAYEILHNNRKPFGGRYSRSCNEAVKARLCKMDCEGPRLRQDSNPDNVPEVPEGFTQFWCGTTPFETGSSYPTTVYCYQPIFPTADRQIKRYNPNAYLLTMCLNSLSEEAAFFKPDFLQESPTLARASGMISVKQINVNCDGDRLTVMLNDTDLYNHDYEYNFALPEGLTLLETDLYGDNLTFTLGVDSSFAGAGTATLTARQRYALCGAMDLILANIPITEDHLAGRPVLSAEGSRDCDAPSVLRVKNHAAGQKRRWNLEFSGADLSGSQAVVIAEESDRTLSLMLEPPVPPGASVMVEYTGTITETECDKTFFVSGNLAFHGCREEVPGMQFLVFPNPGSSAVSLNLDPVTVSAGVTDDRLQEILRNGKISIIDGVSQRVVFAEDSLKKNISLDISMWNAGVYFITSTVCGYRHSQMFVKL